MNDPFEAQPQCVDSKLVDIKKLVEYVRAFEGKIPSLLERRLIFRDVITSGARPLTIKDLGLLLTPLVN